MAPRRRGDWVLAGLASFYLLAPLGLLGAICAAAGGMLFPRPYRAMEIAGASGEPRRCGKIVQSSAMPDRQTRGCHGSYGERGLLSLQGGLATIRSARSPRSRRGPRGASGRTHSGGVVRRHRILQAGGLGKVVLSYRTSGRVRRCHLVFGSMLHRREFFAAIEQRLGDR